MTLLAYLSRISDEDCCERLHELIHLRWRAALPAGHTPLHASGRHDLSVAMTDTEMRELDLHIRSLRIQIAREGVAYQTRERGAPDAWLVEYLNFASGQGD